MRSWRQHYRGIIWYLQTMGILSIWICTLVRMWSLPKKNVRKKKDITFIIVNLVMFAWPHGMDVVISKFILYIFSGYQGNYRPFATQGTRFRLKPHSKMKIRKENGTFLV